MAATKLEAWFQFKGDRASRIQTTAASNRAFEERVLLEAFDEELATLGLEEVQPTARTVVWGTGQIRCSWNVGRNTVSFQVHLGGLLDAFSSSQFAYQQIKWLWRMAWIKIPTSGLPLSVHLPFYYQEQKTKRLSIIQRLGSVQRPPR